MQSLFYPVNHCRGSRLEEAKQNVGGFRRQICFEQCGTHQLHPAVASGLIDHKGRVAHTEAGMAAVFDVSLRTAKTVNEKTPEALFGTGKIAPAIHRAEDLVAGDLLIECRD